MRTIEKYHNNIIRIALELIYDCTISIKVYLFLRKNRMVESSRTLESNFSKIIFKLFEFASNLIAIFNCVLFDCVDGFDDLDVARYCFSVFI